MKLKQVLFAAAAAFAATVAISSAASAAVLYDNGPANGQEQAWNVANGYAVSNGFTLTQTSTVTGVDFVGWAYQGDVVSTVDWGISTGGEDYAIDGTANITTGASFVNGDGYAVTDYSFATGGVTLGAGTYYLSMQNAGVTNGDPLFWDENDGPSAAFESAYGSLNDYGAGSETFQILGASGAPEPATWAMMLVGFGGLGGAMRVARRNTAAMTVA